MPDLKTRTYELDDCEYEETLTVLKKGSGVRGLGPIEFCDKYLQQCSLQDSSAASEPCIWLGVDNTGPQITGPAGTYNEPVGARMHLTKAMVKQLLPFLQKFADEEEYISKMEIPQED